MRAPRLSDDMVLELFQKYCDGVMLKDLAKQYRIGRSTIGSAFARKGLKKSETQKQKNKKARTCFACPKDCRFLMVLQGKGGNKITTHCGYILFPENGARGCDPGPECTRYDPKKKRKVNSHEQTETHLVDLRTEHDPGIP